jgi:hypothetical protein
MDRWVAAPQLEGPWASVADLPAALETAKAAATQSGQVDLLDNPDPDLKQLLQTGAVPAIYAGTVRAPMGSRGGTGTCLPSGPPLSEAAQRGPDRGPGNHR